MIPLVSVIIPCHNQAQYLPDALESLLTQSLQDWECIIVDDGSSDNTIEVASAYALRDSRIRLVPQKNRGVAGARNRGIDEAKGDWFQFLDSDDLLLPNKLAIQLNALVNSKGLALSYCDYFFCDANDVQKRVHKKGDYEHPRLKSDSPTIDMILRWETELSIPIHSFLFDARFFKNTDIRFDESLPNLEDWDCWMQILLQNPRIVPVHVELIVYRQHSNSRSANKVTMWHGYQLALNKYLAIHGQDRHVRSALKQKLRQMRFIYLGENATVITKVDAVTRRALRRPADRLSRLYRKIMPWPFQQFLRRLFARQ